mmetsp:Transcript_1519/g.2716  ORF Transcript_1519/g.2716 Transcript_1519/m.2716 type:complete len:207 (+) Transcript_1519:2663-3283(+)
MDIAGVHQVLFVGLRLFQHFFDGHHVAKSRGFQNIFDLQKLLLELNSTFVSAALGNLTNDWVAVLRCHAHPASDSHALCCLSADPGPSPIHAAELQELHLCAWPHYRLGFGGDFLLDSNSGCRLHFQLLADLESSQDLEHGNTSPLEYWLVVCGQHADPALDAYSAHDLCASLICPRHLQDLYICTVWQRSHLITLSALLQSNFGR